MIATGIIIALERIRSLQLGFINLDFGQRNINTSVIIHSSTLKKQCSVKTTLRLIVAQEKNRLGHVSTRH